MSRWTPSPGPWFYKGPTMADPSAWVYAADERTVCELNDNRDEYEANARLIAAAREMYDAISAANVQRERYHRVSMLVNDWQRIETAFAKAEGRTA